MNIMGSQSIDADELIKFLGVHDITLYTKYKGYTHSQFDKMKTDDKEQKVLFDILSKMALAHNFKHGDAIVFIDEGFRGRGLLFWDKIEEKVIPPQYFVEANIPERFLVGDKFFSPEHWSEFFKYSYLRPCKSLIEELKSYFTANPEKESVELTINGKKYTFEKNDEDEDKDWKEYDWKNTFLMLERDTDTLKIHTEEGSSNLNEERLKTILRGNTVDRNKTRKVDLEAKLAAAEGRLREATEEIERLRREMAAFAGGKRKSTRKKSRNHYN